MHLQNYKRDHFFTQIPFFRLLLPFLLGITTGKYFPVQNEPAFFLISVSALMFLCLRKMRLRRVFEMAWVPGLFIQLSFFSLGILLSELQRDRPVESHSTFEQNQPDCLLVKLISDPAEKNKSFKSIGVVRWLVGEKTCFREDEKILIYFPKTIDPLLYSSGKQIIMRKELRPIENQKNQDFDYRKYCALRHIHAQVFLKEKDFALIDGDKVNSLMSRLGALRLRLLIIIKKQIPEKSRNSLLEALLVGFTDDLDAGLMKSYADTGVIHIIAISGLHLALICQILQFMTKRSGNRWWIRWIRLIGITGCLWAYSLLSGASPSVIRAAAMFSMVLLAANLGREAVLYNTLSASAFLLLCYDLNWLWDTGFQLSYAAVLSLRLFASPIRNRIRPQNKLLSGLWEAASVSLAAQILTTPLCIYYFHRFPTYFLPANLLAVPLSSAVLLGGIALCFFFWIPPVAQGLGWILGILIQFLNGLIDHLSRMPGATVSGLTVTLPQLILLYYIILCFYRFLSLRVKGWMFAGLCGICLLMLSRLPV